MKIANPTVTPALPFKAPRPNQPQDNSPEEPRDSFGQSALQVGMTIANCACESVLYHVVGGGRLGGEVQFGAIYEGVSGALNRGKLAHDRSASKGSVATAAALGGAAGIGFGALRGYSNFVLASAFGGGLTGALMAGVVFGGSEVLVNALFNR